MNAKTSIILLLIALLGCAQPVNSQRKWLADYNISPDNPCPVFTVPNHTGPMRTRGAGICTNDGAAYNRKYYDLGEEWHYEPKLNLCKEEESVLLRVTGILQPRNVLKHGVIPMANGGALVAYRIFQYNQPTFHYFATYDEHGNLIDAINVGHSEVLNDVLKVNPHGHYDTYVNMGGNAITVDSATTMCFKRYYYYKPNGASSGTEWKDTITIAVAPDGHMRLADRRQSGKPDVNPLAERMMMLSMQPLSTDNVIKQWNDIAKDCLKNEQLRPDFLNHVVMLFFNRPNEFITWTYQNKKHDELIDALRTALKELADYAYNYQQPIYEAIQNCPDANARNYWAKLKKPLFSFD